MNRRHFLIWGGATVAYYGIVIPVFSGCSETNQGEPIYFLDILPASIIESIGTAYIKQHPAFVPIAISEHRITTSNRQIQKEFAADNIDIWEGWVLSDTEAKYCASVVLQ